MFRSAPPGGGDHQFYLPPGAYMLVSIRAPGWGRPDDIAYSIVLTKFRSAPPGGGDVVIPDKYRHPEQFRSAPPGGGDS